jgi:AcrR family transcriptional regulator
MSATKQDILASALRILNGRGLSALSLRAVAEDLGLSPGNVSYHFPRKESLVAELVARHGAGNQRRLAREVASFDEFFDLFRDLFRNQYEHRGLVLALPDIMETFEQLRGDYRKVESSRRQRLFALLVSLREHGVLSGTDRELSRVVSHVTLIARFWIGESRVSYSKHGQDRVFAHYLALIADVVQPYTSAAHRDELAPYLDGWIDSLATSG